MLTKEDLDLLVQLIRKENEPIKQQLNEITEQIKTTKEDISSIKQELKEMKEEAHITRETLNTVVEWIDVYFRDEYPLPADKKKII